MGFALYELVQVAVQPTHRQLQDVMKLEKGGRGRNEDTPPNGRVDVLEVDFEAVNGFGVNF